VAKKGKRSQGDLPPSEELVEAESRMNDDGGPPPAEELDGPEPEALPAEPEADRIESGSVSTEQEDQLTEPGVDRAATAATPEGFVPVGLAAELERARSERQEFLDGWQRARAEFANYRKRVEREQEEARARIAGEILLRVLGIMDDLDRALKDRPSEGETAAWAEGIELIYRKFQALLESERVELIQAEGQSFDPSLHEALSHEESEAHQEGHVIEVVKRGYRIGDRVLRPALVRVAK
jgi:molecular chaperone GrpE